MARNLLGILLILAALGVSLFWTRPRWAGIQEMQIRKKELGDAIARFQELKKVRDELLVKYNSISSEDLSRLEEFLPRTEKAGQMLVNIEVLTEENKVTLKNINIQREAGEKKSPKGPGENAREDTAGLALAAIAPAVLPLEVSVSGSYESFRLFLAGIEKNLRLIDVESITFAAVDTGNYDFSMRASAYWHKR